MRAWLRGLAYVLGFAVADDRDGTLIAIARPGGRSGALRSLWCSKYVVAYTYDGYDIRTPSEECNADMLQRLPRHAARYFGDGWPIHVIQPSRQPGEIDYPPVQVTALFTSTSRRQRDLSSLVVVWFQRKQHPIPDAASRATLKALDWEGLALDYEW